MYIQCIKSNGNSIEFSLSNAEQRDSWLNSGHQTLAADRRSEVDEYKVGDLVMLSTKDLRYQMVGKRTEKLMERFVGPYKVQKIVSLNTVKLELPSTVKIHLVVNVSRIQCYVGQVEGQKKKQPAPVIIEGEEEWKVERILNKWKVRGKDKYLV